MAKKLVWQKKNGLEDLQIRKLAKAIENVAELQNSRKLKIQKPAKTFKATENLKERNLSKTVDFETLDWISSWNYSLYCDIKLDFGKMRKRKNPKS